MSRIKEIWCMPHSHLDIGYTHPQPMLLELQTDYLRQALELCRRTMDYPQGTRFCWTVEANYVLRKWMETASAEEIALMKELIRRGQVCIAALPFHTTPCADVNEMVHMLEDLDELRSALDTDINIAINHDVNGQPWTLGQVLLDSGIDFYLTGINVHFGGIPLPRPAAFRWEQSDGRKLTSYLGEHYSLFSQFLFTHEHSTQRMHEGAVDYANWLESQGYGRDFAFLTATNPPLYDNNSPDAELPDLIRKYNDERHEFRIRLVTAQDLRSRILAEGIDNLPSHRGDWTDYWNFGCASTPRETRVSRLGKQILEKSDVVDCFTMDQNPHRRSVRNRCYESALIYDEHTWGASQSVTEPDCPETYSQLVHKIHEAYESADLAAYLLGSGMETLSGNPHQSNSLGGITAVNTSPFPQTVEVKVSPYDLQPVRQLGSLRIKAGNVYLDQAGETQSLGLITVPPFTGKAIPFSQLPENGNLQGKCTVCDGQIITPYYRVSFRQDTGVVTQIYRISDGKALLDESRGYGLWEPVRETVDAEANPPERRTLFPRNVDLGNHSISQWNHQWKARRVSCERAEAPKILEDAYQVSIVTSVNLPGTADMEQVITFYSYQPKIHMTVRFRKESVCQPESLYFAIPLKMNHGWQCSYDTAGSFVRLDQDQLGTACRDWITVDTGVSIYEQGSCVTLACPDAPMVQIGDFGFGRESRCISRDANPLLLAWPLNNYWDTNFCANPSGNMTFSYDLTWREAFTEESALADGICAKNPCVIGRSAAPASWERTVIHCQGASKVLNMYPEGASIRLIVTNPSHEDDAITLRLGDSAISRAEIITPSGKILASQEIQDGAAKVAVPAQGIRLLRLTPAKS